ncbi:hypothetical protein E2C01_048660 [Portunus trituberculatus]|uniref:Uncharacterized protein n=1 Tax=Portunus trituberculatus TaxID=210409 RepID=A0A5B7GBP0_PORTR|nr:hypothetical protein [Portunus trituberculatus]
MLPQLHINLSKFLKELWTKGPNFETPLCSTSSSFSSSSFTTSESPTCSYTVFLWVVYLKSFHPLAAQAILFIVVSILGPIAPPKRIFSVRQ